jgi:hypothetical protein
MVVSVCSVEVVDAVGAVRVRNNLVAKKLVTAPADTAPAI